MVYKIISESSIKFLKLDPEFVYGIHFRGNVSKVSKDTIVHPGTIGDFVDSFVHEIDYHNVIGMKPTIEMKPTPNKEIERKLK